MFHRSGGLHSLFLAQFKIISNMEIVAVKSHDISEWQHRIAELNALNEEVLSTKSNVVVDKYSDESGGINVTCIPVIA